MWIQCYRNIVSVRCIFPKSSHIYIYAYIYIYIYIRAREIVGFAGSGPIFETEDRFISRQEAKKSVHKTLYFSRFCNTQTDTLSPVRIVHT